MPGKIPFEITLPPQKLTYNVSRSIGRMLKKPKIDCQSYMLVMPKFKSNANPDKVKNIKASGVHEKPSQKATTNNGNGELLP